MADPGHFDITHHDAIEGYCDPLAVVAGEPIRICVSTTADRYDVTVARHGAVVDTVWSATGLTGEHQPTPPDADAAGCGWRTSVEVPTDPSWRSGGYVVTLTARGAPADRAVGHAFCAVRPARPTAPALLVLATNTWNAYNDWGGRSLYTGGHQVSFRRPFGRGMIARVATERDDRKARPRHRGEEPDVDGDVYQRHRFEHRYPGYIGSAGWYTYERRFVEWAESAGFDLDVAVSSDLETVPDLLGGYRLVLGVGHDEYWSAGGRDAVEAHVARGGTYASFSGNTMFWQVRLTDDAGAMVCHKYRAHLDDPVLANDPGAMSGMWCDPVVGRPESRFLGAASMFGLYSRFGRATPRGVGGFVVYRDDHWLLDGTDLRYGDVLGADDGIVGYETCGTRLGWDVDGLPVAVTDPVLPDPAAIEIVAWTPSSNLRMGEYPASIAALDDQGDLEFVAERAFGGGPAAEARARHGNAVLLVCRPSGDAGGEVITAGTTDWVFGLGDPLVARVTGNVLRRAAR